MRRGAQGPAGEQRCGEVPRVPQENRGGGSCHVGIGRDLQPRIDASLIRILTPSLHPGPRHSARHNAHTLLHSFRRDSWQASSKKAKVAYSRSYWVEAALSQDCKTSQLQVPTSEWLEWNMSWMERERGGRGTQGTRPWSQMLTGRATEGFYSHHDTLLLYRDTWVPRQLWLGAHLQFRNLPKLLPLFVKKKKKKNEAGLGTEEDTSHSLRGWETAGIISPGWGSATTQTGG